MMLEGVVAVRGAEEGAMWWSLVEPVRAAATRAGAGEAGTTRWDTTRRYPGRITQL